MTRWFLAAVTDWLVIVAAFYAIWLHPWAAFVPAAFLIGSRQHALVVLGHEGGHYLITRDKPLNDVLTHALCLIPMLIPLQGYRAFHNAHHRELGGKGDPELEHKNRFWPAYEPNFWMWKIGWMFLTDLFGFGAREIPSLVRIVWRGSTPADRLPMALWWLIVLGLLAWLHGLWIAAVWMICYSTTAWAIFRVRTITEHPYRTKTPRFVPPLQPFRWLIWPHNVWMHWEHHKRPGLPFYRLSEVREANLKPWAIDPLFA